MERKILILFDQEEHVDLPQDKIPNIGADILFTTRWDSLAKKRYKNYYEKYPVFFVDNFHLLISKNNLNTYSKFSKKQALQKINEIIKFSPYHNSINDIFSTSNDYLCDLHARSSISRPNQEEDQELLLELFYIFSNLFSSKIYTSIFTINKYGWIRSFLILLSHYHNLPVYTFRHTHQDEFYFIEKSTSSSIKWLTKSFDVVSSLDFDANNNRFKIFSHNKKFLNKYLKEKDFCKDVGRRKSESKRFIKNYKLFSIPISFLQFRIHALTWVIKRSFLKKIINKKLPHEISSIFKKRHLLRIWRDYLFHTLTGLKMILQMPRFSVILKSILESKKDFEIMALHFFPEGATTGEFGVFRHESEIVEILESNLANDRKLLVFEHPTLVFFGWRNFNSLKKILNLKNTIWMGCPNMKGISDSILRKTKAIWTLNGSIALEGANRKITSYIFLTAPFLCCENINYFDIHQKKFINCENPIKAQLYSWICTKYGFTKDDFGILLSKLNKQN